MKIEKPLTELKFWRQIMFLSVALTVRNFLLNSKMNDDNGGSKFDCHGIKMNNKQKVKDKELRYMMGGWAVFSYFK